MNRISIINRLERRLERLTTELIKGNGPARMFIKKVAKWQSIEKEIQIQRAYYEEAE